MCLHASPLLLSVAVGFEALLANYHHVGMSLIFVIMYHRLLLILPAGKMWLLSFVNLLLEEINSSFVDLMPRC